MVAKQQEKPDDLLQISDAARVLGISAPWLRDLANQGRIPTLKTVTGTRLFKRGDLHKYMEERRKNPPRRGRPTEVVQKVAKKKTGVRKKK